MITIGKRTLLAKTCLGCGALKMARDFARVMKDYHHSQCHSCKNGRAKIVVQEHQEKALTAAVKHRQPWTDQEIDKLLEMARKGLSGPVMAIALNRSVYAVYTMKHKMKESI